MWQRHARPHPRNPKWRLHHVVKAAMWQQRAKKMEAMTHGRSMGKTKQTNVIQKSITISAATSVQRRQSWTQDAH